MPASSWSARARSATSSLKNLALLGVGTVVVVDLDSVENSNLSRCVLFREADEGRPKARCRGRGGGAS